MEKYFDFENARIYYHDLGAGLPVVLLHGFGEDNHVWQYQIPFLQSYCRLLVPDLPGSGKSGLLQRESASMEDFARSIEALLNVEKIEKCILLGHSMGGYITLAFAGMFPAKLAGFGLVHSTAFADTEEKKNTRRKGIKVIEEYGASSFLKNTLPNLFTGAFKTKQPEKVAEYVERGKGFSKEALVQYYDAMIRRSDRSEVLQNGRVPVLFVVGSEDSAAPLQDLMQQVHLPAISHIHIIKDVGHMGMWEKAEEVNGYLLQFISNTIGK